MRYLSDAYRALAAGRRAARGPGTEQVEDLTSWLGELVHQVDSSLLDEREELANPRRSFSSLSLHVAPAASSSGAGLASCSPLVEQAGVHLMHQLAQPAGQVLDLPRSVLVRHAGPAARGRRR